MDRLTDAQLEELVGCEDCGELDQRLADNIRTVVSEVRRLRRVEEKAKGFCEQMSAHLLPSVSAAIAARELVAALREALGIDPGAS